MIQTAINDLVEYGIKNELITEYDRIYITNLLLDLLKIEEFEFLPKEKKQEVSLEDILKIICDYGFEKGLIEANSVTYRDLFDTKVMGILTPRPSQVIRTFWDKYKRNKKSATDYFYNLCEVDDYIRKYRIEKDEKWKTPTDYGDLDITINLSKPEKDPKAIAAAKHLKSTTYPKCQLCIENEGFAGHSNHPARENLRIIPIKIGDEDWGLQYSPYVYYNEHCIILNQKHTPMTIEKSTFDKLISFTEQFPHYFVGSNADLPIVGGSILSHEHFQGGNYDFAMAKATIEEALIFNGFEDVEAGIVKWPMSVIRLRATEPKKLSNLADRILKAWRSYTDESAFIYAFTNESHNTITPIARKTGEFFELDLVLRNNITTKEHPLGVYHPHEELHHIKKENIGLIEVMGYAILPARLKTEMQEVKFRILNKKSLQDSELTKKHASWVDGFLSKYESITKENIDEILKQEIGHTFATVLEHAGVFKRNPEGKEAFRRFVRWVNENKI